MLFESISIFQYAHEGAAKDSTLLLSTFYHSALLHSTIYHSTLCPSILHEQSTLQAVVDLEASGRPPPLRDSIRYRAKGCPFVLLSDIPFLQTDLEGFQKAPPVLIDTNFEGRARAIKTQFFSQLFQKGLKTLFMSGFRGESFLSLLASNSVCFRDMGKLRKPISSETFLKVHPLRKSYKSVIQF